MEEIRLTSEFRVTSTTHTTNGGTPARGTTPRRRTTITRPGTPNNSRAQSPASKASRKSGSRPPARTGKIPPKLTFRNNWSNLNALDKHLEDQIHSHHSRMSNNRVGRFDPDKPQMVSDGPTRAKSYQNRRRNSRSQNKISRRGGNNHNNNQMDYDAVLNQKRKYATRDNLDFDNKRQGDTFIDFFQDDG